MKEFFAKLLKKISAYRIAPGGWVFVIGFGLLGFLFVSQEWFSMFVGIVLVAVGAFSLYFFRDPGPDPALVKLPHAILSPAQGRVTEICPVDGEGYGKGQVIRIFLSVLDVHTQRAPVSGKIKQVTYQRGTFLDARDQRAHILNEQNAIVIDSPWGAIMVKQIAGLIARRIVCWVQPGDETETGELLGLIRFGSQVNLYLPAKARILVKVGDAVLCARTVIAEMNPEGATI
jgi:phosphatidylserine decarboxylase